MGIFSTALTLAGYSPATGYANSTQVTGVFSPSTLASAIFPDVDTSLFPVDSATAMQVPAVRRGVQIISNIGSRLPLLATNAELEWLNTSEGAITPAKRTAEIIKDLIFYNHSLVTVERDSFGFVSAYAHLPIHLWNIDAEGFILINGKRADQNLVVYIPGLLSAGFLEDARDSVRQYRNINATMNNRTAVPEPVTIIQETQQSNATVEEIDEMKDHLEAALTSRGGIVSSPFGLEIHGFGGSDSANSLMISAREALRKDLANFLGITVGLLDGSNGDSNTYNNAVDERNELLELTVKSFTEPIADRLSQNDVTPPGVEISVDYSSFKTNVSKGNTESPVIPDA